MRMKSADGYSIKVELEVALASGQLPGLRVGGQDAAGLARLPASRGVPRPRGQPLGEVDSGAGGGVVPVPGESLDRSSMLMYL